MRNMTHREYLARIAWLEENWKEPDLTDFYLMQVAQEVRRVLSKKPHKIKLKDFEFKFDGEKQGPKSIEEAAQISKINWAMRLQGVPYKKLEPEEDSD